MINTIFSLKKFRTLIYLAMLAVFAACGGGSDKTYPSYGLDLNTLRLAPTNLSSTSAGQVQLFASGQEMNYSFDMPLYRIDPVTGMFHFIDRPSTAGLRIHAVGFGLIKAEAAGWLEPVTTEWAAKTVWIVQGEKYFSTKDVSLQDGIYAVWFEDAPLNTNRPATLVVEFVSEKQSTLIQSAIRWN